MPYAADIVTLGLGTRDATSNVPKVQASIPLDGDGDSEDFGDIGIYGSLGVSALPADPDDDGAAEGVVLRGVGNTEGACVGARDLRSGKVIAQLAQGETCLHSTGKDFDSRVFCKDQLVSIVVGKKLVASFDLKNKKVTIAGFGHLFEMSADNGVCLTAKGGKAMIQLTENGELVLKGSSIYLQGGAGQPMIPLANATAAPGAIPFLSIFASAG